MPPVQESQQIVSDPLESQLRYRFRRLGPQFKLGPPWRTAVSRSSANRTAPTSAAWVPADSHLPALLQDAHTWWIRWMPIGVLRLVFRDVHQYEYVPFGSANRGFARPWVGTRFSLPGHD